jgi:colanic acid biosynthesis glycosyl transferase WcaI
LRILIVTQYFKPENFRVNDLAIGLKERGHDVEVLTGLPNYPSGKLYPGYSPFAPLTEEFEGIRIKRVPLIPRGNRRNWQLMANYVSFAILACLVGPLRCRGRYDVVFVYEPSPVTVALPGILLKLLRRAPLLFWVQDLWPESLSATGAVRAQWILKLIRRLVDFIYRRCDRVLVSSKGFTNHVLASGIGEERVVYLANWAEDLYRPMANAPTPVQGEMPQGFRVMFAGNIGSAQSFETILEAADRLRDYSEIHWIIVGDGNMRPWVAERVKTLGLGKQLHLLGRRPLEAMPAYFAAADALLVSLRADPVFALTVPSKVQSYLACGKPIIAALDGEGAAIVAESGAGIQCPPENSEKLAQAVLRLYQTPKSERLAMGEKGRQYFERNFERNLLLDRIESWMLDITGAKACAS